MTQEELKNLIEKDKQITEQIKEQDHKDINKEHEACYNTAETIFAIFIWINIIGGIIASIVCFFNGLIAAGLGTIAGVVVSVLGLILVEMMWKSIYLVLVEIKNKLK